MAEYSLGFESNLSTAYLNDKPEPVVLPRVLNDNLIIPELLVPAHIAQLLDLLVGPGDKHRESPEYLVAEVELLLHLEVEAVVQEEVFVHHQELCVFCTDHGSVSTRVLYQGNLLHGVKIDISSGQP